MQNTINQEKHNMWLNTILLLYITLMATNKIKSLYTGKFCSGFYFYTEKKNNVDCSVLLLSLIYKSITGLSTNYTNHPEFMLSFY